MKTKILIAFVIVAVVAACSKDKFNTRPGLSFKSVNTTVVYPNQLIEFTLEYTDKEGDINDTTFFIQKIARNCPASNYVDSFYRTPEFPVSKNDKGEIVISYLYGQVAGYAPIGEPVCAFNDSCVFRFVLRDRAGNASDTVTSPEIVIVKR